MIEDTVDAWRYMRHISDRIKVGTLGSRYGNSWPGASGEGFARERRSNGCRLYVGEW